MVGGQPTRRVRLDAEVAQTRLEHLEEGVRVAVIVDVDPVEIEHAAPRREVAAPIVGVSLEHELLAGLDRADPVGTAGQRGLQRRLVEVGGIRGLARQNRHEPEKQRQFAVARSLEIEPDGLGIRGGHGLDLRESGPLLRPSLALQEIEGEVDVRRGDRAAVREPRRGVEMEGREGARVIGVHPLGDQAVERERLVLRAGHQGLEHHGAEPLGRRTRLEVVGVQTVEGAEQAESQSAALRRIRIGVGEMREAGREGRCTMHGDGLVGLGRKGRDHGHDGQRRRQEGAKLGCHGTPVLWSRSTSLLYAAGAGVAIRLAIAAEIME